VVATSMDKCIDYSDPTAHAELILISEYCRKNKLISLEGYSMYCNVEPCMMCTGAIHWARLSKVAFSVSQEMLKGVSKGNKKPSCKELIQMLGNKVEVIGPLNSEQGLEVLKRYPFLSKKERHKKFYRK
ncbi:MAG: nucleoside deaminase, partial [Bacteroidota bacterium]